MDAQRESGGKYKVNITYLSQLASLLEILEPFEVITAELSSQMYPSLSKIIPSLVTS